MGAGLWIAVVGAALAVTGGGSAMALGGSGVVRIGGRTLAAASHAVVVPVQATPQERHAAEELQSHLQQITGEQLPILSETDAGGRVPIVVGKSALLAGLNVSLDFDSLGEEGIVIRTTGPALVLAGNRRGVLYAVYTFLEDYLGCRWFTPDCTVIATSGVFDIPALDRRYLPPLEYRSTDYPSSRDGDWAVRNKLNGSYVHADEARGGNVSYRGFVHTFSALVPPKQYYAEHPEYYSEVKGKRLGPDERPQLCLTNPDVLRIATGTVRRWMEESPEATVFSVSQNDWQNYCECERCAALAEEEGSQIGPILHFVNAVADAVADEHPGKIIDTLAYQYSRKPPLHVRPRPNVVVRLCSIECCFSHPLESDPFNESFRADTEGWSEVANRLWVWDYVINYAHCLLPFPNLHVIRPNIKFYLQHGVTGIYEEADYFTPGGELAELRTYLMAKTLWDPSYDTDKAIDEFCAAYYGRAAGPIRQYLDLIRRLPREKPDVHMTIYVDPDWGYLTPEVIAEASRLFDQAESAVADDRTRLHRVQVARLPIQYARLALGGAALPDRAALLDQFEQVARAEGVTMVSEWKKLDAWLDEMRALPASPAPSGNGR
jgi:hypothetical protein